MAQPEQSFHTCLVGVPLNATQSIQVTQNVVKMRCSSQSICNTKTPLRELWDVWDDNLPVASLEPQESDILGTLSAEGCVFLTTHWNMICGTEMEQESKMLLPVVSGLNRLACFVAKRVNETSLVLSSMAIDSM